MRQLQTRLTIPDLGFDVSSDNVPLEDIITMLRELLAASEHMFLYQIRTMPRTSDLSEDRTR